MDILTWILFGLIVGVIVNIVDPRPARGGILGAVLLGIIGALAGGFLSNIIFGLGVTGFNLQSIAIAVGGAIVVLLIARLFEPRIQR